MARNPGYPEPYSGDPYNPGKRHREDDFGPNKLTRSGGMPGAPETVYRFLCDANVAAALLAKGQQRVREIQSMTGSNIQLVNDAPPHCSERVVVVSSHREPRPGEMYNPAQQALFELFNHQMAVEQMSMGSAQGGPFLRMLICATQAGSLIGKAGVTIKELTDQSGCQNIKVLQPEDLPPCGLKSDKLLHITGSPDSLRKVLQLASARLRDSPPKEMPSQQPCMNAFPPVGKPGQPPMRASMPMHHNMGGTPPHGMDMPGPGAPGMMPRAPAY